MAHYLISEASRKIDVEAHVLRYWEEELELKIPRNDLGHRYYTEKQIDIFKRIKELKEQGYQLKAIRANLEQYEKNNDRDELNELMDEAGIPYTEDKHELQDEDSRLLACHKAAYAKAVEEEEARQARMREFQNIMTDIVANALERNNSQLSEAVSNQVSDRVMKEMNYLLREQEEREEQRFKHLDETIRAYQRGQKPRAETAATKAPVVKLHQKKGFGRKVFRTGSSKKEGRK